MSRAMAWEVNVSGVTKANVDLFYENVDELINIDSDAPVGDEPDTWSAWGNASLCGGKSYDHHAEDIYKVVRKALGRDVHVEVIATFLEQCPFERMTFGPEEDDG